MLESTCRTFANDYLRPNAAILDREQKFSSRHIEKLTRLGLLGICAPLEYGGSSFDTTALSVAVEELSRGCSSTGVIVSIHNALVVNLLNKLGTVEQKETFLKDHCTGNIGFFALSESEAGSDAAALTTVAKKDGDHYILNGTKAWVTSAEEATGGIVFATIDKKLGYKGITAFYIPLNTDGVTVGPRENKIGVRASSTCSLHLKNVKVPETNVIGSVGDGFKIAMTQLDQGRIGIASQAVGIAQAALDAAIDYAGQRKAFGQLLLEMPTVKVRLAEMAVKVESARLLTRKAAQVFDSDGSATLFSSMAKLAASEAATFSANNCITIMGGMGIIVNTTAERLYRDAKITEIYGGVVDIQKLVIADQLIKQFRANIL